MKVMAVTSRFIASSSVGIVSPDDPPCGALMVMAAWSHDRGTVARTGRLGLHWTRRGRPWLSGMAGTRPGLRRAGRMGPRAYPAMEGGCPCTLCRTGRTWKGGSTMTLNIPLVLRAVLEDYDLPWDGDHGIAHWARVTENGLRVAGETGANVEVVRLFALLHDSRRVSEVTDPDHGPRAAEFASSLRGRLFDLPDHEFRLLHRACSGNPRADPLRHHDPDLLGRRPAGPRAGRHHPGPETPLHRGGQAAGDDQVGRRSGDTCGSSRSSSGRSGASTWGWNDDPAVQAGFPHDRSPPARQAPQPRRDQFDRVARRVPEIERPPAPGPLELLLDHDAVAFETTSPSVQAVGPHPRAKWPGPLAPCGGSTSPLSVDSGLNASRTPSPTRKKTWRPDSWPMTSRPSTSR